MCIRDRSVTWSILVAVPFLLIGIFIPDKALALLGADAGLIGLGRNYVRIILIATPFFMSNYTFTAFARNDGAPSIAMIGSISGSIFNIIFDYIFMFPVGLGFSGAGLATAICPIAVSYTHLDVYKRQAMIIAVSGVLLFPIALRAEANIL